MIELAEKEMLDVNGGAISWGFLATIASGLVFIIGVFDGFTNPSKCHNK